MEPQDLATNSDQSVKPISKTIEQSSEEPVVVQSKNFIEKTTEDITKKSTKSGKHSLMIAILAILAVCGLGFGVYEHFDGAKKDTELKNLRATISKTDPKTEEAKTESTSKSDQISQSTGENNNNSSQPKANTVASSKAAVGPHIKDGYFYVPEWGWKFKLPNDLTGFGFAADYDEAQVGYDLPSIGFTAVQKSDLISNPQTRYYDNITSCTIIEVNKTLKSSKNYRNYAPMGDDKETKDYVLKINKNRSRPNPCYYNKNIDKVYQKLKVMFQNPENI